MPASLPLSPGRLSPVCARLSRTSLTQVTVLERLCLFQIQFTLKFFIGPILLTSPVTLDCRLPASALLVAHQNLHQTHFRSALPSSHTQSPLVTHSSGLAFPHLMVTQSSSPLLTDFPKRLTSFPSPSFHPPGRLRTCWYPICFGCMAFPLTSFLTGGPSLHSRYGNPSVQHLVLMLVFHLDITPRQTARLSGPTRSWSLPYGV